MPTEERAEGPFAHLSDQAARLLQKFSEGTLKKFVAFELPTDDSPQTLLAIGEIVEYACARLRQLGVDPTRTKFFWAESIDSVR